MTGGLQEKEEPLAGRRYLKRGPISFAFLLGCCLALHADDQVHLAGAMSETEEIRYDVPNKRMLATPAWDEDFAHLPLSFAKAQEIARSYLHQKFPEQTRFQLRSITLVRAEFEGDLASRWAFNVSYFGAKDGHPTDNLLFSPHILLDGTVVEPQRTKRRK